MAIHFSRSNSPVPPRASARSVCPSRPSASSGARIDLLPQRVAITPASRQRARPVGGARRTTTGPRGPGCHRRRSVGASGGVRSLDTDTPRVPTRSVPARRLRRASASPSGPSCIAGRVLCSRLAPGRLRLCSLEHFLFAGRHADVVHWATLAADEAAAGAAFVDEVRLRRLAADSAKPAGVSGDVRAQLFSLARTWTRDARRGRRSRGAYRRALASASPSDRTAIRIRLAWLSFRRDDLPRARRRVAAALRQLTAERVDDDRLAPS